MAKKRGKAKAIAAPTEEVSESGLTPQQEKFAQLVAMGMNQSLAYRQAYNAKGMKAKTINECASRLMRDRKVTARVAEIRKPVIAKARYGLTQAMEEAERAMHMGLMLGQPSAAVSAVALRARLNGLEVDPRKNDRDPYAELSDEELERSIAESQRAIAAARGTG